MDLNGVDSEVKGLTTGVQRLSVSGTTGRQAENEQVLGSTASIHC